MGLLRGNYGIREENHYEELWRAIPGRVSRVDSGQRWLVGETRFGDIIGAEGGS